MRKRIIPTLVIVVLLSGPAAAQKLNQPIEENLYFRALQAVLEGGAKANSNPNPPSDFYNVIVEDDLHINRGFPEQIKSFRVQYLGWQELINKYKEKKERFQLIVMRPISNEGDKIVVSFGYYWISYEKKSLNYSLEGGTKVIFRYDCDKRGYVIDKIDSWAI